MHFFENGKRKRTQSLYYFFLYTLDKNLFCNFFVTTLIYKYYTSSERFLQEAALQNVYVCVCVCIYIYVCTYER